MNIKVNYSLFSLLLVFFFFINTQLLCQEKKLSIEDLSKKILSEQSLEKKLIFNNLLIKLVNLELKENPSTLTEFDSTALLKELLTKDKKVQIITWSIPFSDKWEYFGFLKVYNENKKLYNVWELTPTDFELAVNEKQTYNENNWPAGVYFNIIETSYNKRIYYTLTGWLAEKSQTAFKFIEVLTINRSGKPSFGKSSYFSVDKKYYNRVLFSYNHQSSFQLNYGNYTYTEKKWNRKKKRYDVKETSTNLLVFDHLIPMYPDLKDHAEFLVPAGNIVDAFTFERGKWRMKKDIDARNMKRKYNDKKSPELNLFPIE